MFRDLFEFVWGPFWRSTWLCPCLDCCLGYKSNHSDLPESWERIFAPCRCSFIQKYSRRIERSYIGSNGIRRMKRCLSRSSKNCALRILYVNHMTGESTLKCPCAQCCPDRKGTPCLTLGSLFDQNESARSEEGDDPLIPSQDLTRVGKPCWRLGDFFDDPTIERRLNLLDDDSIIPAQDVSLSIFDDMPGFALARNHIDLTKMMDQPAGLTVQSPSNLSSKSKDDDDLPLNTDPCVKGSKDSRQRRWSLEGVRTLFPDWQQSFQTLKSALSTLSK